MLARLKHVVQSEDLQQSIVSATGSCQADMQAVEPTYGREMNKSVW